MPIKITTDASPVGVGAVLSQIKLNSEEKAVSFASRALTKAERGYNQLDREALGLVFGVKSFHQYVYGREFILECDNKPITHIFGPKKGIPQMAAGRLQRWAVFLTGYDFKIKHIKGENNGPADSLSRLIKKLEIELKTENEKDREINDYTYLNYIQEEAKMLDCVLIATETENDPILSKVCEFIRDAIDFFAGNLFFKCICLYSLYSKKNNFFFGPHRKIDYSRLF